MKRKGAALTALVIVSIQSAQASDVQVVDSNSLNNSSLSVKPGETLAIDFHNSSSLNLSGDLHNDGSIYIFSSTPGMNHASIQSASIFNGAAGIISTVLPVGGLTGVSAANGSMSLTLVSASNILNYGSITSSGNLSLAAANSISNISSSTTSAIMSAVGNVQMSASNVINNGLIASAADLNIATRSVLQNLNVIGTGGIFSAAGAINISTSDVLAKLNTSITGGDFIATALNINSGKGILQIDAGQITGLLNVTAGEAHVTASSPNLALGSINLSGDPTFYNHGDVIISGDMIFSGAPLAIVAGGNIKTAAGAGSISTASSSGSGAELTLVAGANFTVNSGNCCVTAASGDSSSILTILGASATGGSIDLSSGSPITSLSSASTGGNGSGGTIRLVAFANADPSSGRILLPSGVPITSGGHGAGQDGAVSIVAGAASGNAIFTGAINTSGGSTQASVNLSSGNATITGGGTCAPCITIMDGRILSGTFAAPGNGALSPGNIVAGDLIAGSLTAQTAGALTLGSITADGLAGAPGGSITLLSQGALSVTGSSISAAGGAGTTNGGVINITAASLAFAGHLSASANASGAGKGGDLQLTLSAAGTTTLGSLPGQLSLTATGGSSGSLSGDGGKVSLIANNSTLSVNSGGLNVDPAGLNGKGGSIVIQGRHIQVNGSLSANGSGTGDGGSLALVNNGPFSIFSAAAPDSVSGKLSATAGAAGGSGGTISVTSQGDITLGDTSAIDVHATYGNGGVIDLNAGFFTNGRVVVPGGGTLSVDAAGDGNAGRMSLFLDYFSISGAQPLTLSANGAGNGNGGFFQYFGLSSTTPLVVGNGAGQVKISATGGSPGSISGNAGSLFASQATNIIIDPTAIDFRPLGINGNGGTVLVSAGFFNTVFGSNSNVRINGSLHLDGVGQGNGGSLQVQFSSNASFTVGSSAVNGLGGVLTARSGATGGTGGGLVVSESGFGGGGIVVNSWADIDISTTNGSGGFLSLNTTGNLSVPSGNIDLSAVGTGDYNGGSVRLGAGGVVTFSTPGPVILRADATGNGNGGQASFQSAGNLTIGGGAGQVQIYARGGSPGSLSGNGGSIAASGGGGLDDLSIDPVYFRAEPLGQNGNGANINLASRNISYAGSLNADGVGTGSGGVVFFQTQSNSPLRVGVASGNGVAGTLTARGGANGGNGGYIYLSANGGLAPSDLDVSGAFISVSAPHGNGGTLHLGTNNIGAAVMSLSSTTVLSADGGGGNYDGGQIDITVNRYTVSGATPVLISANAAGNGNGGRIAFTTFSTAQDFSIGIATKLLLSATGGSAGSSSGNGGSIQLVSGRNLIVDVTGLAAGPLGVSGDGATLSFTAGNSTPGNLQINGDLLAEGKASGKGGAIALTYADAANAITLGAASATSYVNGMVSANTDSGAGGKITIRNSITTAPLSVIAAGTVSAKSQAGSGTLDVSQFGQPVTITGGGSILANLFSNGSTVQVSLSNPSAALSVQSVAATAGNIALAAGQAISVVASGSVTTTSGHISAVAPVVTIAGRISSNAGNVDIASDSFTNDGLITVNNAAGLLAVHAAGPLILNGAGVFRITGGAGGSISFTAGAGGGIDLNGSYAFDPGVGGNTRLTATTITLQSCAVETLISGNGLDFIGSNINIGANAFIHSIASGANIQFLSNGSSLNIGLAGGSSFSEVATTDGNVSFGSSLGKTMTFFSAMPGTSTLKVNTGGKMLVSASSTGGISIAPEIVFATDSDTTFSSDGGVFNLAGQITSSKSSGSVSVRSTSTDLTIQGGGTINFVTAGANSINLTSASGKTLSLQSSIYLTADPGAGGSGQVVVSADTFQLIGGASITTPLALTDNMMVHANTISLAPGSTSSLQAANISITPNSGTAILFSSPGPQAATLNLNNNATVQAGAITVQPSVRLASSGTLSVQPSSALTVDGKISAPSINIAPNADLLVSGNGSITATAGGANAISIGVTGAHTLSLSGNLVFDPSGGKVLLGATASGGAISVSPNTSISTNSGTLTLSTPSLSLGQLSNVSSSSVSIDSGAAGNNLSVTLTGSSAKITATTSGIDISPSAGGSLTIASGGGAATLDVAGAMTSTTSSANTTIAANVTLAGTANIVFNVNGGTFSNDGAISTSAAAAVLTVQSSSTLQLSGSGSFTTLSNGANAITFSIGGPNQLVLNPNFAVDAGANGTVHIDAQSTGASIVIPAAANQAITGAKLHLSTPTVAFGAGSSIAADSIALDSGSINNDLTIMTPTTSTATVNVKAGGTFSIDPPAGKSLTFASNGPAATINFNGAPLNISTSGASGNITVNSGVTVSSDNSVSLNINGGTFTNDGDLTTTAPGGSLVVQSTGNLAVSGKGNLSVTSGAGSIKLSAAILSFSSDQTFSPGATGSVNLSSNGIITFNTGTQSIAGGAALTITSPVINFGNASKVTSSSGGAITFTSTSDLALNVSGGGTSTVTSAGGTITLSPAGKITATTNGGGQGTVLFDCANLDIPANAIIINSSTLLSSTGTQAFTGSTLTNDGSITAAGSMSFQNNNGVSVSGTGSLSGTSITADSGNGAVSIVQGAITAPISGASALDYTVITSGPALTIGSITSRSGSVAVTNNGGTLTVSDGSNITANSNVSLTAGSLNVGTVGGGITVVAGELQGQLNASSTDMMDYDSSGFVSAGSVLFRSTTGGITVADNLNVTALGGSIGFSSAGKLSAGNNETLFAQGGNIWLNAFGDISLAGGNFTAVARGTSGNLLFPVANLVLPNFQGGDIAIDANVLQPAYDSFLRSTYDLARVAAGNQNISSGVSTAGSTLAYQNGGTVNLVATGIGAINVTGSTLNANGAVIHIDPPGAVINIANVTLNAFGPSLAGGLPPPVVPAGAVAAAAAVPLVMTVPVVIAVEAEDIQSTNQGLAARSVPVDTTRFSVGLASINPPVTTQACTTSSEISFSNEDDAGLSVASGHCQPFSVQGNDGTVLVGRGGTSLGAGRDRSLNLAEGKLVAVTARNPLVVVTLRGQVTLPSNSAMIIEETSSGVMRVTNLGGGSDTTISISSQGEKQTITASAGQEIIVADRSTAEEELIPVDGIERVSVGAKLEIGTLQMRRNSINRSQLLSADSLLSCPQVCIPFPIRTRLKNLSKEVQGRIPDASSISPIRPIAFTTPVPPPPVSTINTVHSAGNVIKHTIDASFEMATDNVLRLRDGELLVNAKKPTVVISNCGSVEIRSGAIALVSQADGVLSATTLWESSPNSVHMTTAGRCVSIAPGCELLAAEKPAQIDAVLRSDSRGRRRIVRTTLPSGHGMLTSELSFVSMFVESKLISEVFKSREDIDKQLSSRMAKMAVVLSVVTGKHGNYSLVNPTDGSR